MLFLDEVAEFARSALDALRQPLEDGKVQIVRGQRSVTFPARAMLVAACNPCPCARPPERCSCARQERDRYARRLSGPLLDRIDLVCEVEPVPLRSLTDSEAGASRISAHVQALTVAARERQVARLAGTGAGCNGDMDARQTRRIVRLEPGARERLLAVGERDAVSGRGHDRVLRVARTIADLAGRGQVATADVDEALGYRVAAWGELAS